MKSTVDKYHREIIMVVVTIGFCLLVFGIWNNFLRDDQPKDVTEHTAEIATLRQFEYSSHFAFILFEFE